MNANEAAVQGQISNEVMRRLREDPLLLLYVKWLQAEIDARDRVIAAVAMRDANQQIGLAAPCLN